MADPPRDSEGLVTPHNDPDIPNDSYVLRYIKEEQLDKENTPAGKKALNKAIFSPSNKSRDKYEGMSIDLLFMIEQTDEDVNSAPEGFVGSIKLLVGELREMGLMVGPAPMDKKPFHGNVWGLKINNRKKRRALRIELLKKCKWHHRPVGAYNPEKEAP